ncbi:MAG: response regulator [Candidatus Obscuribacterales bacterium]|nr:response regulator [Candidatus Obscuribacterales bacterium]
MGALILALLEKPKRAIEVKNCLEQYGNEVCVINSFAEAIDMLQARSFDLIISDVHLENGGNVFDFLKWLKGHQQFHTIPFVLFSLEPTPIAKYLADGVRAATRYLGAAKYITMEKFDYALLNKEINELLVVDKHPTNALIRRR